MRSHNSLIVSASPSQVNIDKGAQKNSNNIKSIITKTKTLKNGLYVKYRAIIFMYNFI